MFLCVVEILCKQTKTSGETQMQITIKPSRIKIFLWLVDTLATFMITIFNMDHEFS